MKAQGHDGIGLQIPPRGEDGAHRSPAFAVQVPVVAAVFPWVLPRVIA